MHKNVLTVVGITILFLGMSITPSIAVDTVKKPSMPTFKGNTLYVGGSGEGNYTMIQDAIDNTSDGDTVFVYNGIYHERIRIYTSINLIGENIENTIMNYVKSEEFKEKLNMNLEEIEDLFQKFNAKQISPLEYSLICLQILSKKREITRS